MALNWDLTQITDWEKRCYVPDSTDPEKRNMNPVTEILVFATITVGLAEITAKNIDEWELRLEILNQMGVFLGRRMSGDGESEGWNPSRKDLEEHLGLKTNAFPDLTRHKYKVRQMQAVESDARRAIEERRRAAESGDTKLRLVKST